MLVYVLSTETTYQLSGGTDNTSWAALGGGISGISQAGQATTFTQPDTSTIVIDLAVKAHLIDGYWVTKGAGSSLTSIEVGDYCIGWEGDTLVGFKVTALPYLTAGNRSFALNNEI